MNEHNKHLESIQANGWITGGQQEVRTTDGGPGSGNFGHSGRPGEIGGSGGGGGNNTKKSSEKKSSSKSKPNLNGSKFPNSKDKAEEELNKMLGNRGQFTVERTGVAGFEYKLRANGKVFARYNDMSGELKYDKSIMLYD